MNFEKVSSLGFRSEKFFNPYFSKKIPKKHSNSHHILSVTKKIFTTSCCSPFYLLKFSWRALKATANVFCSSLTSLFQNVFQSENSFSTQKKTAGFNTNDFFSNFTSHFEKKINFPREFTPPAFFNKNNSCWIHSGIQILLASGNFFQHRLAKADSSRGVIKALRNLNSAITLGDKDAISKASLIFHNHLCSAEMEDYADLLQNPNEQKDAALLFEALLPCLNYTLQLEITRQGLDSYTSIIKKSVQPISLLKICFKSIERPCFQDMLNDFFSTQISEEPRNAWKQYNMDIPRYIENNQIVNCSQNLPHLLFVQAVRFASKSPEELRVEKSNREKLIAEMLPSYLQEKRDATDEMGRKFLEESIPPIDAAKKIEANIIFPSNNRIDFSRAFKGCKGPAEYELFGVVRHEGNLKHGHYTVDVLRKDLKTGKRQWFYCNDQGGIVRDIPPSEVKKEQGYIFAFRRVIEKKSPS